jgi:hypothetical protein
VNLTECTRHKKHCENGDKPVIICSFSRNGTFDVGKNLCKTVRNNAGVAEVYLSCQLKKTYQGDKVMTTKRKNDHSWLELTGYPEMR